MTRTTKAILSGIVAFGGYFAVSALVDGGHYILSGVAFGVVLGIYSAISAVATKEPR